MLLHKGPFQDFDVNQLEAQLVKRDRRRLYIAFGAAMLLHASTVVGFTFWTPPEPVAPPGDMVITIDLAPAVYSTATQATAGEAVESTPQMETEPEPEPEEPETVEPPEPQPPEPVKEEEVVEEPVPEPVPQAETVQENIEVPPPAEEPEVAISPKKIEKPKKKKIEKKKKQVATAASQAAASATNQRSDVGGSGAKASPSDLAKYIGRVRSALERAKRYPAAAGGASGTVSLRFTINRAGAVTGFAIVRSSGNSALDAAVRQMAQNASLPPIPAGLPESITIGVPVNFSFR